MSAFMHHPEHFAAVVGSVYRNVGGHGATSPDCDLAYAVDPHTLGAMGYYRARVERWGAMHDSEIVVCILQTENARSVAIRYKEEPETFSPVTNAQIDRWEFKPLSDAEALMALDSIEFQSCESKDWQETEACRLIQRMRGHLTHRLTRGCDTWSITEPPKDTEGLIRLC